MRHAEHPFHRADGSTDSGADSASNHASDRPGDPVTFMCAFLGAAHDALRTGQLRQREPSERQSENGQSREQSGQALRRTVGKGHGLGLAFEHDIS
jgi:hypothetical protein